MYKSKDHGATWISINNGLPTYLSVQALVIDPVASNIFYIGTKGGGVYISKDCGDYWTAAQEGAKSEITALAIDSSPEGWALYAGIGRSLWKSTDGGHSWQRVSVKLSAEISPRTEISPTALTVKEGRLYVGTPNRIFVGTENGADWQENSVDYVRTRDNNALLGIYGYYILALITFNLPKIVRVPLKQYRSRDWTGLLLSALVFHLVILFCIYNHNSWSWGNFNYITGITVDDPKSPNTFYLGANKEGVHKSIDGGATWNLVGSEARISDVEEVQVPIDVWSLVAARHTLYIGTTTGIYRSLDSGISWIRVNDGLPIGTEFPEFDVSYTPAAVGVLAIDPVISTTIYAGVNYQGFYKSTNAGDVWEKTSFPDYYLTFAIAINPITTTDVYVGTNGGVYKTSDGGDSWIAINEGLPAYYSVYSLIVNPDTLTLYAGTERGLYRSIDNGARWTYISRLPRCEVRALAVNPLDSDTMYAGIGSSVYKSVNGGDDWVQVDTQYRVRRNVSALMINPITNRLYVGAQSAHISQGADGGVDWSGYMIATVRVQEVSSLLRSYFLFGMLPTLGIFFLLALWKEFLAPATQVIVERIIKPVLASPDWKTWISAWSLLLAVLAQKSWNWAQALFDKAYQLLVDIRSGELFLGFVEDFTQFLKDPRPIRQKLKVGERWEGIVGHPVWSKVIATFITVAVSYLFRQQLLDILRRNWCVIFVFSVILPIIGLTIWTRLRMREEQRNQTKAE